MPPTTDISLELLDRVRVASPCPVTWDEMDGDGPVRHCRQCDLEVYNFSEMSEQEIGRILSEHEGRICAGFRRRADGTILTRDCPVGLAAIRARTRRALRRVAAAVTVLLAGGAFAGVTQRGGAAVRAVQPFRGLCEWLVPAAPPVPPPNAWIAGEIRVTPGPGATEGPACGPGENG